MQKKIGIEKLGQFTGHNGSIYGLYAGFGSKFVYTGAADGYVVRWNLDNPDSGELVCRLSEPVYCIFLDESTHYLWIGTGSGNIHVVDMADKKELKNIAYHQKGVYDIKEIDGEIFAAGGDGVLSCFERSNFQLLKSSKVSDKSLRVISFHEKLDVIACGSSDFGIYTLSKNLEIRAVLNHAHDNSVFSLAFSSDAQYLLSGGRDAMLKIWRFEQEWVLVEKIAAHNLHVHSISVQKNGTLFLTTSMDKTIKIWDLEGFKLLKVIDKIRHQGHVGSVNKIAWVSESDFVSVSDDKTMMHWRIFS